MVRKNSCREKSENLKKQQNIKISTSLVVASGDTLLFYRSHRGVVDKFDRFDSLLHQFVE